MKDLSIEEKAKRYDEAIKKAESLYKAAEPMSGCNVIIETLFPELKESEDERIRKWIIGVLSTYEHDRDLRNASIAWLEKQGEQNTADKIEPKFKVGNWVVYDKYDKNDIDKIVKFDNDKVSFESGDWLYINQLNEDCKLWTIQDAKDGDVLCCENGWTCIFKALDNHTNTFSSYCFMDSDKWFCNTGSEGHTLDKAFIKAYNGDIHPATKEQCDLLFQKMKEAGYEWDAEKRELKKIEKKPINKVEPKFKVGQTIKKEGFNLGFTIVKIEDSFYYNDIGDYFPFTDQDNWELVESAWSEEDERMFEYALDMVEWYADKNESQCRIVSDWLKSLKNRVQPQPKQEWSEEDDIMVHDIDYALRCQIAYPKSKLSSMSSWIYKLKNRVQPKQEWKPSDKQMEYLLAIKILSPSPLLESLYIDLKKLREE